MVVTFDPQKAVFARLPDPFEAQRFPEKDKTVQRQGICYIGAHDVYFVPGPTAGETKVYHPDTGAWEAIGGGEAEMFNGYCQYDPAGDQVVMTYHHRVGRLRYKPSK